ncbi:MAG: hypothetical protein FWF77_01360, partial [Defluviitaleaceae bacterium]|nr:hypothetical protein [Defluviitaleaceae bacterium]
MEKRILAIVMAVFLIAALAVAVSAAQAVPSAHEVRVDGETVDVRAFNIGGRNYFMLRDVAYILRDTGARFDIEWDANRRAILLETGDRYGGTPAEIDTSATTAATSRAEVYVNGVLMNFAAYNIRGHNFFQLRELGDALGFGVDFDAATNAVLILTDVGYSPAGLNPPEPPAPTPEPTPAPTPEAEESVEPDVEPDVEPEPEATPAPTPAPAAATGGG